MTAEELKNIREANNLTKGAFAASIDITAMMQGRYEGGKIAIPDAVAEKVMQLYSAKKDDEPVKEDAETPVKKESKKRGGRKKKTEEPVPSAAEEKKTGTVIVVQSLMGGEITVDEVLDRVKATAGDVEAVYVKPEENRIYYNKDGKAEFIQIWE